MCQALEIEKCTRLDYYPCNFRNMLFSNKCFITQDKNKVYDTMSIPGEKMSPTAVLQKLKGQILSSRQFDNAGQDFDIQRKGEHSSDRKIMIKGMEIKIIKM